MGFHAQMQGLQPAHGQEGVERAGDGADRVLQEAHLLGQLVTPGDHDAADDVGMAIEVLGGRVQHQVGAVFQRALQHRRAERVVDHQDQAVLLRKCGHLGQIDQLEHRVGRRFGPDHPGFRLQRCLHGFGIIQVDKAEIETGRAPAHFLEQAVGAAIEVVHCDDVAARIQQIQHRGGCRQTGGEGEAGDTALQVRHAALVSHAGRVLAARIFIALVLAGTALHIGGGGVDRRHDGAGAGIGLLAGMYGAGTQAVRLALAGGFHQ